MARKLLSLPVLLAAAVVVAYELERAAARTHGPKR
jgi:hypothetical protein